jgi:hypothetical protein
VVAFCPEAPHAAKRRTNRSARRARRICTRRLVAGECSLARRGGFPRRFGALVGRPQRHGSGGRRSEEKVSRRRASCRLRSHLHVFTFADVSCVRFPGHRRIADRPNPIAPLDALPERDIAGCEVRQEVASRDRIDVDREPVGPARLAAFAWVVAGELVDLAVLRSKYRRIGIGKHVHCRKTGNPAV